MIRMLSFGLFLLAPLAPAQVLYVDDDATGAGTGTSQDPFPDIMDALDDPGCVPGTTVMVLPGVYSPFTIFTNDVTVTGQAGPMETVVDLAGPIAGGASLRALRCTVEGLWFRGATDGASRTGLFVGHGTQGFVGRCVFSDLNYALSNAYDLFVDSSAIVRCGTGYVALGQDFSQVTNTVFWDNGGIASGSLTGQPTLIQCFIGDPVTFGANDFHLRRVSPCIDAGLGQLDPDGSVTDIGPYPYDWNYPLGMSYCFNAANSSGGRGRVQAVGSSSLSGLASGHELTLHATRCPAGQFGLFIVGDGRGEIPLAGGGTFCVGTPLRRIGPVALDGAGSGQELWLDATTLGSLQPGDRRSVQFWHRDSAPGGVGLTHAAQVELRP